MGSRAFTHPVDLTNGDVQAEKELRDILREGRSPAEEGVAVVQAQGASDLREHKGFCHAVIHGDVSPPGNGINKEIRLQTAEAPPCSLTPSTRHCLPEHPLGVDLQAKHLRPCKSLLSQVGGLGHILLDSVLHLFPDAWHPHENSRLHFLECVHQGALCGMEQVNTAALLRAMRIPHMSLTCPSPFPLVQPLHKAWGMTPWLQSSLSDSDSSTPPPYMHVCMCACVCKYACMYAHVYICVCMHVCLYACVCACVYMYRNIKTDTHNRESTHVLHL